MADDLDRAKSLLLGAVETALRIAATRGGNSHQTSTNTERMLNAGSSSRQPSTIALTSYEEHRKLFGHASQSKERIGAKRKQSKSVVGDTKRKKKTQQTWKKDVLCLRLCDQETNPSTEEKMHLAKLGLGLKQLVFDSDGGPQHIHDVCIDHFPGLLKCGGYTLLRLSDHSKTNLIEIESPDSGMTVPYLKDILRQAKLFIRPLQCDIPEETLKDISKDVFSTEPEEFCQKCSKLFSLPQLRKHVTKCGKETEDSDEYELPEVTVSTDTFELPEVTVSNDTFELPEVTITTDTSEDKGNTSTPSFSNQGASAKPLPSVDMSSKLGTTTTYNDFIELFDSDSDFDDVMLQDAIQQTSTCNSETIEKESSVENVLLKHRQSVLSNSSEPLRITVRRHNIWKDSLVALGRKFDERKPIQITFLGESGIDDGGPRREFFMLLLKSIANNSAVLSGPLNRRILQHNTAALQDNVYYIIGKIIALSFVHGGPPPTFFAPCVIDYIIGGIENVEPSIDDIPDLEIQDAIRKLNAAQSDVDFREIMGSEEYSFRFDCGVTQPHINLSLSDREKVVSALCLHYTVFSCLAELEQLCRGLSTFQFSMLVECHTNLFRPLFINKVECISASFLQDMWNAELSAPGSNKRIIEEQLTMCWINFLISCEETGGTTEMPSLTDILVFLTGSDVIPPLGFKDIVPKIIFSDDCCLPSVSTCAMTLKIPLDFPNEQEEFNSKMGYCILNSQGYFGQP